MGERIGGCCADGRGGRGVQVYPFAMLLEWKYEIDGLDYGLEEEDDNDASDMATLRKDRGI